MAHLGAMKWAFNRLGVLFGPFKGFLGGFKPFEKGIKGICPRNFVWKIDRKLPEMQVETSKKNSLKLFPSTRKLQINQSE
tara:strand:- start:425 stop:664 length:240 start_codon:yes stop_codon:yes gene_type:complete